MQEFARVLDERLESCITGSFEQPCRELKNSVKEVQETLPLVPEKEERDWVLEKVCEVLRKRAQSRKAAEA